MAAGSLIVGAASAGLSAYGQAKSASAAKANARAQAQFSLDQSALANSNADQVEAYGALNTSLLMTTTTLNNQVAQQIADTNIDLLNTTAEFNVGIIKATTDFNVTSAEGAARLLEVQGSAQEAIANVNADYMEVQAQQILDQGNQAERQSRATYSKVKGQQRAALAANGVALDEGSALRIQSDTDYASEVDADVIQTSAMQQALGYRAQAVQERTQGIMASLNAKSGALQKRGEAFSAKINGMVATAQTKTDAALRTLDTKMTTSMQILQNTANAKIEALNIKTNAKRQALDYKAQGLGFKAQSESSTRTANAINPTLMAGTSLLGDIYKLSSQATSLVQAGAI